MILTIMSSHISNSNSATNHGNSTGSNSESSLLTRGRRTSRLSPEPLYYTREFRDVVFEDVVFDNNNCVTPYQVKSKYKIR